MSTKQPVEKPVLTLRVHGPRPGRIGVADLAEIVAHAQTAVNRQAEVLEGRSQTLRPGPPIGKVRAECELELVSLGRGSTVLGFDLATPQTTLPAMATLSTDAIAAVARVIDRAAHSDFADIDVGVLDSIRNLGAVLGPRIKSLEWIAPGAGRGRHRRPTVAATLDARVRRKIESHLAPPTVQPFEKQGVLEMADFKPDEYKCRLKPTLEAPVTCTFDVAQANEIQAALRHPVRVVGRATISAQTHKVESVAIDRIEPLDSLELDAGSFFAHPTFDQLVRQQAIKPLRDIRHLAGGIPDDLDVDELVDEIYRSRV